MALLGPGAAFEPAAAAGFRPGIAVWDTGHASAQPFTPDALAARDGWIQVPARSTPASFQGDAVLGNGRLLIVVRKDSPTAEVYAVGPVGATPRLRLYLQAPGGEAAARLERVALAENTPAAACLAVAYRTRPGTALTARFRLKRGEPAVQAEPGPGADRLHVACPSRFLVLPDFFADDLLIDPRQIPLARVDLPSENFVVHLTGQGEAAVVLASESRRQDSVATLAEQSGQKVVTASEIPFEGKKVWIGVLEGPGTWHTIDVRDSDAGKVIPLGWHMPFPAQWRLDLTSTNGLTDSWELLLQQGDGTYLKPSLRGGGADRLGTDRRRWNTVLGFYPYPCWIDSTGQGRLQPLKDRPLQFRGPGVLYPLGRVEQTPRDAYTVVDLLRTTLGVGPCEHLLDREGQRAEYRGRATCSVRDELGRIYGSHEQKAKRAEVEKILDEGLAFVTHIRSRITRYVAFGHALRHHLAEQRKAHPELGDFLDEMDRLAREIDARVAARRAKIQTPAYVARMNDRFRQEVLDDDGPDALARCRAYTAALVVIGDNQDELSGECRWVVKSLRQRATIRMALDPRVAPIAQEIRARTQEALRNPANHEGAGH